MGSLGRYSHASDRALGLVMVVVALLLGGSWALTLGLGLPDLRSVGQSLGLLAPARLEVAGAVASVPAEQTSPAAPHCAAGVEPSFVHGFGELKRLVGEPMGEPIECEHTNPDNGDAIQQTSTGLAYYRQSTNTPTFTDGWKHWALTERGLVTWTGESVDPPRGPERASGRERTRRRGKPLRVPASPRLRTIAPGPAHLVAAPGAPGGSFRA